MPPSAAKSEAGVFRGRHIRYLEIAALVMATVIAGLQSVLLRQQVQIAEQQVQITEKQNQVVLLQAFLSTVQAAGIETQKERRSTNAALNLYDQLIAVDRGLVSFKSALPSIRQDEYETARRAARTEDEQREITQTFSRLQDQSSLIPPAGEYLIVLTSVKDIENARRAYVNARALAAAYKGPLETRVFLNGDNFYIVALAWFPSEADALTAIQALHQEIFKGPRVGRSAGWATICKADLEACRKALDARSAAAKAPRVARASVGAPKA